METKRCQRCHKLLRSDAQVCSRCGGYDFMRVTTATKGRPTVNLGPAPAREAVSIPSNPPASPHRVGHYSGLHPEDQPYQSSFLPVAQASPAAPVASIPSPRTPAPFPDDEEAGDDLLPYIEDDYATLPDESLPLPAPIAKRRVASYSPAPQLRAQRGQQLYQADAQDATEAYHPVPSVPNEKEPLPLALVATRRPRKTRGYAVPVLLVLSCFLFLVATSILAFLLMSSRPAPTLAPQLFVEPAGPLGPHDILSISGNRFPASAQLHFTRDNNIAILDANGAPLEVTAYDTGYFSVLITIPSDWSAGKHIITASDPQNHSASATIIVVQPKSTPPLLHLAVTSLDLGGNDVGTTSQKALTLTNTGGQQVHWQARSDAFWLSVAPAQGVFTGSAVVQVTANRNALAPLTYSGHVIFTELSSHQSITLTVTMAVNSAPVSPASANLVISSAALNFSGNPVQSPAGQGLTLQNTGGQSLNWTATVATSNGGNWLALSATSGSLAASSQQNLAVTASSLGLSAGTYNGTLTFNYGGTTLTPVTVTLVVSPPPVARLAVQPGGLIFNAILGQNPAPQSFVISNTGNAPLNWGITEDSNGATDAPVSASHGTLAPGRSASITVTPSITQLSAGTVSALITVADTDAGTPVKSQQVKVTFNIVNQAVISLNENAMSFSHTSNILISTQTIIVTDSGSATLNWSLTISNPSPVAWLTTDNNGGTLTPGTADFANITANSSSLAVGTYTATIHIQDTDAGTPVASQTITVTLVVTA